MYSVPNTKSKYEVDGGEAVTAGDLRWARCEWLSLVAKSRRMGMPVPPAPTAVDVARFAIQRNRFLLELDGAAKGGIR